MSLVRPAARDELLEQIGSSSYGAYARPKSAGRMPHIAIILDKYEGPVSYIASEQYGTLLGHLINT